MLNRTRYIVAQHLKKICKTEALDGLREGLPAVLRQLESCSAATCLTQARGATTTTGSSSSNPGGPGRGDASRAAAAAVASTSTSGSVETPLSFFARQQQALAAMPLYPKMLGFAGALPFMTLNPAFLEAAGLPDLIDYCAKMQVVYGGSIVTFLGAVHWGLAMNSATVAAAGSRAAGALNERYVWSVVPSLAVVPALMMHPAQGSFAIMVLLGICYLSDASYFRSGYLPRWYISLRGFLTLLAMLSMLATTSYYFKKDVEKAKQLMEEEDAKRAARLEARVAAGPSTVKAAAAAAAVRE